LDLFLCEEGFLLWPWDSLQFFMPI
jgi:hypothetical protein